MTPPFSAGAALFSLRRTGQSARHDAFFMPETLRAELAVQRAAYLSPADPSDPRVVALAGVHVGPYHSFVPLDEPNHKRSRTLGVQSSLFRATSSNDGESYALRRLEGGTLPHDARGRSRVWSTLSHPNLVKMHELLPWDEGGQAVTYIVQAFHPNSVTLEHAYLQQRMPLNEETLWSHALQMVAALHAIHLAGLAARVVDLNHVLLTGKETTRLSCAGILDFTRPDSTRSVVALQVEDLAALGRLLINLACTSPSAASPNALQNSMSYIQASFSADFSQLVMFLLSPHALVHDVVAMISGRMMNRLSQVQYYADGLYSELGKESENGRLLRLLFKLNLVADRAMLDGDDSWGTSSDRQLIRYFRESLTNQTNENGAAVLDLSSLVSSLNKLDMGVDGQVLLSSPHDGALLLVAYSDIKSVLERSFDELAGSQGHQEG